MSSSTTDVQHLLTLKVMRLSKPSFSPSSAVYYDSNKSADSKSYEIAKGISEANKKNMLCVDRNLNSVQNNLQNMSLLDQPLVDIVNPKEPQSKSENSILQYFGLSDVLVLPSSFGSIYLGETFSAYICVNNDSNFGVKDVVFRSELQTSTQRFSLQNTSEEANPGLLPTQTIEFTINHEIRELGTHILVCSVSYTTNTDDKKSFRRFYKFQVLNPLAVRTKVNLFNNDIFLEAQVQNLMSIPMFIDRLRLDAVDCFRCEDLNYSENKTDGKKKSIFGDLSALSPNDVRQYLFKMSPKDDNSILDALSSAALGRLDILWRSSLGEIGRLQTNQLTRKVGPMDIAYVKVTKVPSKVVVETPFQVVISVKNLNRKASKFNIILMKETMGSVWFIGESRINLGEFLPDECKEITLTFFPSAPGFHRIQGLKISDEYSEGEKLISCLEEFLVHRNYISNTK